MPLAPLLAGDYRTMARNYRFEIAKPGPVRGFIEIDFRNGNRAPLFRLREQAAIVADDAAEHPVARNVFVRAAHDVNLIFAGARAALLWIAAPDWPRDDLS